MVIKVTHGNESKNDISITVTAYTLHIVTAVTHLCINKHQISNN